MGVKIPMLGVNDSLNVGHAAALLMYEALYSQEPQLFKYLNLAPISGREPQERSLPKEE